jgi:hypothetical protein
MSTFLTDLGFSRWNRRPLRVDEQIVNTAQLLPDLSISGSKIENLSVNKLLAGSLKVDEYIQSSNFVENAQGWRIKGDGTAQFKDISLIGGVFRYGKTSFSDSSHSGYYFGPEGIYIGAASDTSKLKYSINNGTFDFIGDVIIDSSLHRILLGSTSGSERIELRNKQIIGYGNDGVSIIYRLLQDSVNNNILTINKIATTPSYGNALNIQDTSTDTNATIYIQGSGQGNTIKTFIFSNSAFNNAGDLWQSKKTSGTANTCFFGYNVSGIIDSVIAARNDYTSGKAGYFYLNSSSNSSDVIDAVTKGSGLAIYAENAGTTNSTIYLRKQSAIANSFYKMITFDGGVSIWLTIWIANNANPNGVLNGSAGDICMSTNGNVYRCTGGTNWVAM